MPDTRFSVRMKDAEDALEVGAALAGESRSEFIREAVRERAQRIRDETTMKEEGQSDE